MVKKRLSAICILPILACLFCPGTGAATTENAPEGYCHYVNTEYGYSLDYPPGWALDTSRTDMVLIGGNPPSCIVSVFDSSGLPLALKAQQWLRSLAQHEAIANLAILSSQRLPGKWDWVSEYTYMMKLPGASREIYEQCYLKEAKGYLYKVLLQDNSTRSWHNELQTILDSFQIISELPREGHSHYINTKYNYSLYYPSDWHLGEVKPEFCIIESRGLDEPKLLFCVIVKIGSVERVVNKCIQAARLTSDDFTVLSNHLLLSGKWDWFLEYVTRVEGLSPQHTQAYFKSANGFTYSVLLDYKLDSVPSELLDILESFQLRSE